MSDDLPKPDPRNAPGEFYALEGVCLSCGLPEDEAPDLLADLKETNGETFFVKQPATPDEIERACSAIEVCCVRALRYSGNDESILKRLLRSVECCDVKTNLGELYGRPLPQPTAMADARPSLISRIRTLLGFGN